MQSNKTTINIIIAMTLSHFGVVVYMVDLEFLAKICIHFKYLFKDVSIPQLTVHTIRIKKSMILYLPFSVNVVFVAIKFVFSTFFKHAILIDKIYLHLHKVKINPK